MPKITGGVWPAMFTPLTDDYRINADAIVRLVEMHVAQGLDGIYLLGSTGHGPGFPVDQRKQVAELTIKAVAGRLPVMVHVGATATIDCIELAQHACDVGADAVSSVPPIYPPGSGEIELEHYRRIAEATDLPFYPYFNTGLGAAMSMPVKTYVGRLLDIPHMAGMKFTGPDMYTMGRIIAYAGDRLKIFSGADEAICQAALTGAVGAIGTTYSLWGKACRKMRHALIGGQFEPAKRFMHALQKAIDVFHSSRGSYNFFRVGMQALWNIDIGPGRLPFANVNDHWTPENVLPVIRMVNEAAGV